MRIYVKIEQNNYTPFNSLKELIQLYNLQIEEPISVMYFYHFRRKFVINLKGLGIKNRREFLEKVLALNKLYKYIIRIDKFDIFNI